MPTLERTDSSVLFPVSQRQARIGDLLHACGPSDVTGFVMTIVVDAIKCQRGMWTSAHVGKEMEEPFAPALADMNTSCAVVPVFGVVGVMTALNHLAPQRVFRRLAHTVGSIGMMASTRGRGATTQITDEDFLLLSANASTEQVSLGTELVRMLATACHLSSWGFRDDCPITNDSS